MQNVHTDETAATDLLIVLQGNFATLDFFLSPLPVTLPSPRLNCTTVISRQQGAAGGEEEKKKIKSEKKQTSR